MSRRPASVTQADVARIIRAAKQAGESSATINVNGTAIVVRFPEGINDAPASVTDPIEWGIADALAIGSIYFIGFGNYVKIGFTLRSVERRLAALQTGAPERLEVFATISETMRDEADLHHRFRQYRTAGEWFRRSGELQQFIEGLRK